MTLSRVLGGVGRTFISMGLILLLFVAYQLWGTGIQEARAQSALQDDFEELLDAAAAPTGADADPTAADSGSDNADGSSDGTAEDSTDADDGDGAATDEPEPRAITLPADAAEDVQFTQSDIDLVWRPEGDAAFRISIDRIGLAKTVVEGVSTDDLRKGPGHYPSTPLPGQPGNAAIAGHRTTYGAPFNRIDELKPGDEILIETVQGVFTYKVVPQSDGTGHFVVSPDRVEVLSQDNAQYTNRLTLTACHPKYSAAQRIIVVAELVNEPVVAVPRPGSVEPAAPTLASEDLAGDGAAEEDGADGGSTDSGADNATDGEDTAPADGGDDGADDSDDPAAGAAGAADGGDSGDGGAGDGSASDPVGTDEV
ncbi:MAG: class E sortase, partial [Acidimicrobiales bacterium]|nr:class E sortase [Acidimicrobiales bacterium]